MNNKFNNRYVRVDMNFFNLPEIDDTFTKLKGNGFAMAVVLLTHLLERKHTIGRFCNLGPIAAKLGIQRRTLIRMLCECPVFRVDMERELFYAPRLRKKFKLPVELSDDEVNDILNEGNIYYGNGEKRSEKVVHSENVSKSFSKRSEKFSSQQSDNQEKYGGATIYSKDKDISNSNIEIVSNKGIGDTSADDDADVRFREILSYDKWRRCVSRRLKINLNDDRVLGIFASWMASYCISVQKDVRSVGGVRNYACNLLRPGSKTRAEFEGVLKEKRDNVTEVRVSPQCREFEFVFNGMRFSNNGQLIPIEAPAASANGMWFSYINNCWVDGKDYHKDSEECVLKRRMKENPGYIRRIGGVA